MRCLVSLALAIPLLAEEPISFNRDVRPILSDTCFKCHGPDEKERKGGLRLDLPDAASTGGDSGPAFVPGKPEESELMKRLHAADPDDLMPPKKSGKSLKPAEIATLGRWIAEGGKYEGHWAFQRPKRPQVPVVNPPAQNPIDAFIHARLAKEGLAPSPAAPKETWIRRVSLDLTGLPPATREVDAFLQDSDPNAFEKVVDRLLASPAYGETMAMQWLDFARYADSNGFQSDTSREQWLWRDWVINAFNRNLPFDQFTIEQLAGDLLPNAKPGQVLATGFHRNHRLNGEGGRIVEEWFAENVIDRVETTGLTWMGLTLGCARCHDHKYDPISQREFYQLFSYFNSIDELGVMDEFGGAGRTRMGGNSRPVLALPTPAQEKKLAELKAAVMAAEQRVAAATSQVPAAQAAWEKKMREQLRGPAVPAWTAIEPSAVKSEGGAVVTRQADGTWLASGKNPELDVYTIDAPLPAGTFTGLLLDALPDPSLPEQSLGRNANGNFVLTDVDAEITAPGLAQPLVAEFTRAEADYAQKGWDVASVLKDKPKRGKGAKNKKGWAVDGPTRKEPRKAIFVCAPLTVPPGATLRVTLRHDALAHHNIGRFKLSATSLPPAAISLKGGGIPPAIQAALLAEQRSAEQTKALAKFYRDNGDHPARVAEAQVAAARKAVDELEQNFETVMVMQERKEPRDAFILKRGEYDKPGDKVSRAVPAALGALPAGAPNNRLGFAQWLVSGEHPLTSRVWVNRAWEKFFGTGLVKTTENLGSQAEWPSHPELLDWLATEFVRLKWDMKAMQKLIVLSATYRQSARVTPALLERDPENRLLARGPRFRLSGETLRDQALALSGLLVPTVGGPSVKPYMPAGVWDETSVYGNLRNYQPDAGEGLYRRSLYTIWKRTAAPPTMLIFDAPNREICTVKRSRTNTPHSGARPS
jgi:hypothetical protein